MQLKKSDGSVTSVVPVESDGSPHVYIAGGAATTLPTGAATETTLAALNTKVTAVNTGAVVVSSSALPSGAATAAKQPALGTAAMAASSPVTIASNDTLVSAIVTSLGTATFSTPAAVTCTGSATALTTGAAVKGVRVQADYTNTTNVRIGDTNITTSRGVQLAPGDSIFVETANASNVFHIAESGSPKINVMIS